MAGTVDLVQRCFSGLQTGEGKLWFSPAIPAEVRCLRFALQYRGSWIDCEMTSEAMTITSREGAAKLIHVVVNDEHFELAPGAVREVSLV